MHRFYTFIPFTNDTSEIMSHGHFDICQVLCVEQPYTNFNTCNAQHEGSRQNKRFTQNLSHLAENGLPTVKALSVEIFFFRSFHNFNLRQPATSVLSSVYSLYNKQVKIPY